MPFMQRLTWDGIALHGGQVPGRPVSHGCIRIPEAFAQILYHETKKGGVVIVSPDWHGTAGTYTVAWDADPAQLRMDAIGRSAGGGSIPRSRATRTPHGTASCRVKDCHRLEIPVVDTT